MAAWIADYYASPIENAVRTILPSAVRRKGAAFKQRLFVAPTEAAGQVFNIAYGGREYLIEIYRILAEALGKDIEPVMGPERAGDIRHAFSYTATWPNTTIPPP